MIIDRGASILPIAGEEGLVLRAQAGEADSSSRPYTVYVGRLYHVAHNGVLHYFRTHRKTISCDNARPPYLTRLA